MSANEIRSQFLNFFAAQGHEIVPSSSLVPRDDPTLMFTNAGMVPFKNVFTGQEQRPYRTAASAQKCVRAGGKHNDLDNVGYTARHHTFFEMLGNFSFGDYFKERAIELAWRLLHREWGLPAQRLIVTVFHEDDEAAALWRRIAGLDEGRVLRIATSDNFWSMGDTGPCGPCSEIFYDHGEGIAGGPPGAPDADGDRFVEIWNLVFMQFDQKPDGARVALPRPSIDTGMGLERIAAVLQGTHDNYAIDLLRHLIEASAAASGTDADGPHRASHRIIADHLRACGFLLADGVMPSNEGRGYVLRRIMRRAMRHVHLLGVDEPMMHRLVPSLVAAMGGAYPELGRAQALIAETLKQEETRFRQTLARGLKLLDEEVARLRPGEALPGAIAFRLYDTYGFPYDLTEDALRAQGHGVDRAGFEAAMAAQRAEARAAWVGSGDQATDTLWFDLKQKHGASEFLGYDTERAQGTVLALVRDGASVDVARAGDMVKVLANQTPFYGESGGQMGDTGLILGPSGRLRVRDTLKPLGLIVHEAEVESGSLKVGDIATFAVDGARRRQLRANHSATHLLHEALRRVLGAHVTQKGSLVAPERLRFDFAHMKAMTPDEIAAVEDMVNAMIWRNEAVET
ncbi:MAG: alanine--tRNA ligase, partial [Alphaproteobacteria bacterium]